MTQNCYRLKLDMIIDKNLSSFLDNKAFPVNILSNKENHTSYLDMDYEKLSLIEDLWVEPPPPPPASKKLKLGKVKNSEM